MYITQYFHELTEDKRPQDDTMDGTDLTFETLEHGGEFPDLMPQVIKITDKQGRNCLYEPIHVQGRIVDFQFSNTSKTIEGLTRFLQQEIERIDDKQMI